MRKLYATGYDVADNLIVGIAQCGYWVTPGTKILDYGCGEGGLTYRFRDLGFDAYGFDIHSRVKYRDPSDMQYFGFIENPETDTSNMMIGEQALRLPFDDNSFDVVVSTSVLEHVMDLFPVMSEIARVLKPTGVAYHAYPSREMWVEPHMYVPLATRVQNWWWFYFWALLGIRNEYQEGVSAKETADRNLRYAKTGVRYPTREQVLYCCRHFFDYSRFADQSLNYNSRPGSDQSLKASGIARTLSPAGPVCEPTPKRAVYGFEASTIMTHARASGLARELGDSRERFGASDIKPIGSQAGLTLPFTNLETPSFDIPPLEDMRWNDVLVVTGAAFLKTRGRDEAERERRTVRM